MTSKAKLLAAIGGKNLTAASGVHSASGEWSDRIIFEEVSSRPFSSRVNDGGYRLKVATEFFNFFYHGAKPSGTTVNNMIVRAISIASTYKENHEFQSLWKTGAAMWYSTEVSGGESLGSTRFEAAEVDKEYVTRAWKTAKIKDPTLTEDKFKESLKGVSSFKSLEEAHTRANIDPEGPDAIIYTNAAAFTASVALRVLGKGSDTMVASYIKSSFHSSLIKFAHWTGDKLPGPCKTFLQEASSQIQKSSTVYSYVISHFLNIKLAEPGHIDKFAEGFVQAACLTHLQFLGMPAMKLALEFARRASVSLEHVLRGTWYDQTAKSWGVIVGYLNKYNDLSADTHSKVWFWARVYSDSYFADLKADQNSFLCAVLGGALQAYSPIDYEGIMTAAWTTNMNSDMLDRAKDLGEAYVHLKVIKITPDEDTEQIYKHAMAKKESKGPEPIEQPIVTRERKPSLNEDLFD